MTQLSNSHIHKHGRWCVFNMGAILGIAMDSRTSNNIPQPPGLCDLCRLEALF